MNTKCWCGRPLHYESEEDQAKVQNIIDRFGEYILVKHNDGNTYKVPRHYIGIHGIKDKNLLDLKFEVVNYANKR